MQDGAVYNHLGYMQNHPINSEKHRYMQDRPDYNRKLPLCFQKYNII